MKRSRNEPSTTDRHSECQPEQIDRYLNHELSLDEEAALIEHCDHCLPCCQRFDEIAADDASWQHARSYLSSTELDAVDGKTRDPKQVDGQLDGQFDAPHATDLPLDSFTSRFLAPTDDPRMLGRFAGHEITGVIGSGGMGIVIKGLDPSLGRYAAIKVLSPHYASSGAARKRFAREARAAAAVVHDNVIAIHAVGQFNDLPYLVMPLVRGESLQKRIDREGPFSLTEILRIAAQVLDGLSAAHAQGLIHRDIKPANILLSDGIERVFITDFGLARAADDASLTRSGVIAGTPAYMSPEQARGEPLDPRSDLFSVGSLMYAMATGRPPFRAETPYGVLQRINDDAVRPVHQINPGLPAWLSRLIAKLHAKSRDNRYTTADEVAGLLRECLTSLENPSTELPMSLREPAPTRHRLRRWAAVVAVGLMLSGLIAAVMMNWRPTQRIPANRTVLTYPQSIAPKPSLETPPPDPFAVWDDPQPERLLEQTQQLVGSLKNP